MSAPQKQEKDACLFTGFREADLHLLYFMLFNSSSTG